MEDRPPQEAELVARAKRGDQLVRFEGAFGQERALELARSLE